MNNFMLSLTFVITLVMIPKVESFDICILMGNCDLGQLIGEAGKVAQATGIINIQNDQNNNARNDPGEDPVYVDGQWIESSKLNTNQIYLFAKDAPTMTWSAAEKYCEAKGAFLAEPFTEGESNFLRDQANRLPKANWWIGLREFEKCECTSVGRAFTKIEAFVESNSLHQSTNNGLGLTFCPSNFQKSCNGREWRWGFSGQRATYTYWNTKTGEPNSDQEHCVTMWFKGENQHWGDWVCTATQDSGSTGFKPVCQKTKNIDSENNGDLNIDDYDYDDDDEDYYDEDDNDDNQNSNLADLTTKCVAQNVAYKFGKNNIIDRIRRVKSFQECQTKCNEVSECKYWKWKGHKPSKKCILSRNIKRPRSSRRKTGVISGTTLNGCKPGTTTEDPTSVATRKEYCVEYGATYNGGNQIRVLNNIENAELCREQCLIDDECSYYTFSAKINKKGRKKKKCTLKSAESLAELDVRRKKHSMAGSVVGDCAEAELSDVNECHCVKIGNSNSGSQNSSGRTSLVRSRSDPNDEVEEFFIGPDGSVDEEIFFDQSWKQSDILGDGVGLQNNAKCRKGNIKRCTSNLLTNQQFTRGEYCVDYNVRYDQGDEFKVISSVNTAQSCRFECLSTQRTEGCRFYSWSSFDKRCHLIRDVLWFPFIEKDAVSGTLDGLCKTQSFGQLGECECQKIEVYDDYDDDYPDLVSTGLVDVRSGAASGCPEDQGKRCYARVAVTSSGPSDFRSAIGRILPEGDRSDAVNFG